MLYDYYDNFDCNEQCEEYGDEADYFGTYYGDDLSSHLYLQIEEFDDAPDNAELPF